MTQPKRTITAVASLALVGVLTATGVLLNSQPQAEAQPQPEVSASPEQPLDAEVQEAIDELQANYSDLVAQQESERAEAAPVFELPPGTDFGPPESLESINAQIEALESPRGAELLSSPDVDFPSLYWYEDGFFASIMAIDWKCAWLSTGVQQVNAGDMNAVVDTVDVLHSFTATDYAAAFPDYDYFLENQVDPLLDGNTSGALQYLPSCVDSTRVD